MNDFITIQARLFREIGVAIATPKPKPIPRKIDVIYIKQEDQFVKDLFRKGHVTWKPF